MIHFMHEFESFLDFLSPCMKKIVQVALKCCIQNFVCLFVNPKTIIMYKIKIKKTLHKNTLPYIPYLLRVGRPVSARGCDSPVMPSYLCWRWSVSAALELRWCRCRSSVHPPLKPHWDEAALLCRSPSLLLSCTAVSTRRQQRTAERRPNSSRFLLSGWLQVLYLWKENTMSTISHSLSQQNNT